MKLLHRLAFTITVLIGSCSTVLAAPQTIGGIAGVDPLEFVANDDGTKTFSRYDGSNYIAQTLDKGQLSYVNGAACRLGYYNGSTGAFTPTLIANFTYNSRIHTLFSCGSDTRTTLETRYISGTDFVIYKFIIDNLSASTLNNLRFYAGADNYLSDGDNGGGSWDANNSTIFISNPVGGGILDRMGLQGVTSPHAYESRTYSLVRNNVNAYGLTNALDPFVGGDNGYALEWRSASLAAGSRWEIQAYEHVQTVGGGDILVTGPRASEITVGGTQNLLFTVNNNTGSPDSVSLVPTVDLVGWTATLISPASPANIAAGGTETVTVEVDAPGGATVNQVAKVTLTATGATTAYDVSNVLVAGSPVAFPVVSSPTSGSATYDRTPTISGTAPSNADVTVFIDFANPAVVTATAGGSWSYTPSSNLSTATHQITALATVGGVESSLGNITSVQINTVPPPVITSPTNGSSTYDRTPDISGTALANALVTVSIDSVVSGTTTADGSGNWSYTVPSNLSYASHSITAITTESGSDSAPSTAVNVTVDEVTPPIITAPADQTTTFDRTPDISGTSMANALIDIYVDGNPNGQTTASGSGVWSYTVPTNLSFGTRVIRATATVASVVSVNSANTTIYVRDIVPAPVILSPTNGATVDTSSVGISGTALANTTVTLYDNAVSIGTTTADSLGAWSTTQSLSLGSHSLTAIATDQFNIVSASSSTILVTVVPAPTSTPTPVPTTTTPAPTAEPTPVSTAVPTPTPNEDLFGSIQVGRGELRVRVKFLPVTGARDYYVTLRFANDSNEKLRRIKVRRATGRDWSEVRVKGLKKGNWIVTVELRRKNKKTIYSPVKTVKVP